VKILIELAPEHYDGLLNNCRDTRVPEYAILKSGVMVRYAGRRQVEILCETHQARNLLVLARSLQSPAVDDIKRALGFPLDN
jgi:hypothetical protein